jgi:presenilin-like A22 family membrane protease
LADKTEKDKFKVEMVYLIPILASLLFGLGCAYLLVPSQVQPIPVMPLPDDTAAGPWGNALYFVMLIAISATVFYILLKRRSKRIIMALIFIALTMASLLLSLVYLSAIFMYFPSLAVLLIPLAIFFTVLMDLAIFRLGSKVKNTAVVLLGGALGVFFGYSIPLFSAIAILAFLAVYDIFAVYRGPVGKIAEAGLDQLHGLSFSFKEIQMGLGDLVFYSMLLGIMIFEFFEIANPLSILPAIVAILGILAGSMITFFMLDKKGIFPGLPFPILLGLVGGLTMGFLIVPILF